MSYTQIYETFVTRNFCSIWFSSSISGFLGNFTIFGFSGNFQSNFLHHLAPFKKFWYTWLNKPALGIWRVNTLNQPHEEWFVFYLLRSICGWKKFICILILNLFWSFLFRNNLLTLCCVTALCKATEALPHFLSPYLVDILIQVGSLQPNRNSMTSLTQWQGRTEVISLGVSEWS